MTDEAFEIDSTYVHLKPDGSADMIEVDETFWSTIGQRVELHEGYLVTRSRMTLDWPHWEMHPEGEELVILLEGAVELVLDDGQRQWKVELRRGAAWLNRRGVWHRAIVHEPSDMLFVTAGRGTLHRPV